MDIIDLIRSGFLILNRIKTRITFFIIRMKSEIENAAVKVRLFLRDDLTKKELAGAKLQILDEDGKILTCSQHRKYGRKGCLILGLNPEKTYRIVEVLPRKAIKKKS